MAKTVNVVDNGSTTTHKIVAQSGYQFEICSREGTFAPTIAYMNEESEGEITCIPHPTYRAPTNL